VADVWFWSTQHGSNSKKKAGLLLNTHLTQLAVSHLLRVQVNFSLGASFNTMMVCMVGPGLVHL
jgi:hypothetical protein